MDSILNSIKKLLGIPAEQDTFDTDIIIHINSAFSRLRRLGVGPEEGFKISDDMALWDDFTNGNLNIEDVRTYVYLKVKLVFDPPLSSVVLGAIERNISQLESELNISGEFEESNQNGET